MFRLKFILILKVNLNIKCILYVVLFLLMLDKVFVLFNNIYGKSDKEFV